MKYKQGDVLYVLRHDEIILITYAENGIYSFEADVFFGYSTEREIEELFIKIGEL